MAHKTTSKVVVYTIKEKILLANLVDKHKLVENKKTDAATIQEKQKEWENIAREYNAQGDIITVHRTSAQLKKLWNNLKQRKRKVNTEEKYARLLTGGGSLIEIEKDPVMDAVNVAAPNVDVELECEWDSTAVYCMNENGIEETENEENAIEVVIQKNNVATNEITCYPSPKISETREGTYNTEHRTALNKVHNIPKKQLKQALENEGSLRLKKLRDSIEQQTELHNIKMQVEEELLKKISAERKKAEAESELACLKLRQWRHDNTL